VSGQLGLGPNVLAQHLPRLQDKVMGLEVVQVHAGRGFTVIMTQLSVEHLMLLNYEDEDRFKFKKQELLDMRRKEHDRLKAAKAELNIEHKRQELLRRRLVSSNTAQPPTAQRVRHAHANKLATRLRQRSMQVIEVSARRGTFVRDRPQRLITHARHKPSTPPPNASTLGIPAPAWSAEERNVFSPTSRHMPHAPTIPPMWRPGMPQSTNPPGPNGPNEHNIQRISVSEHDELAADVKRSALEWGSEATSDESLASALRHLQIESEAERKSKRKARRKRKSRPAKKPNRVDEITLPYRSLLTGKALRKKV
jgi:hypothetical protein